MARETLKQRFLPWLLVGCTLLVAFWLAMASRSERPFQPFDLTAADFSGFRPAMPGWNVQAIAVSTNDPAEPNILAFEVIGGKGEPREFAFPGHQPSTTNREPATVRLFIRLVHGYNMPMCMKIKGYAVENIGNPGLRNADLRPQTSETTVGRSSFTGRSVLSAPRFPHQRWRVTSSSGDVSIWVTSMLRAGDFETTDVDICSMAFPRVDVPDDPRWTPRGLSWADLKHPVANLKRWGRARWNASRMDVLTFLRLRQPAWASDELLTCVTCSLDPLDGKDDEDRLTKSVLQAHEGMIDALRQWRRQTAKP